VGAAILRERGWPEEISRAVTHCTGGGIVQHSIEKLFGTRPSAKQLDSLLEDPLLSRRHTDYVARYYMAVNEVSTTFVIGCMGELFQTLDEKCRAWSAGISPAVWNTYAQGYRHWSKFTRTGGHLRRNAKPGRYDFWLALLREITGDKPIDLAEASPLSFFANMRNPDLIGVSIDLVTPPYQRRDERGVRCWGPAHPAYEQNNLYTKAQYATANRLLKDLASAYPQLQLTRRHILPDSFCRPIERHLQVRTKDGTLVGYGYDPGALLWHKLLAP